MLVAARRNTVILAFSAILLGGEGKEVGADGLHAKVAHNSNAMLKSGMPWRVAASQLAPAL